VFPCKDVPFWGFNDAATHLGGQIAQKPQFWGVNRHFPAKYAKYLTFILQKLLNGFQRRRHLEKLYNRHISATV